MAFAATLAEVEPHHLTLKTPCSEWDVRSLINHVLIGTRMSVQMLSGMDRDHVTAALVDDLFSDADDVVAVFTDLAEQMVTGFSQPAALQGVIAHPAGDFPRPVFIGYRIADAAVHAWDLATAIASDRTMDDDIVQFLWDASQIDRKAFIETGVFGDGPSGSVGKHAPLQDRYLDFVGRRP